MHGFGEGPDLGGHGESIVVKETWGKFREFAEGKKVKHYYIWYPSPNLEDLLSGTLDNNVGRGVHELGIRVQRVLENCPIQKIVLVGYSMGAWVINEWLSKNNDLWKHIRAVELYGDPLWRRKGNDYLNHPFNYGGVARFALDPNPYNNNPPGPEGKKLGKKLKLANRWQSRCLKGDPVCGEGYNGIALNQLYDLVKDCAFSDCEHVKYAKTRGYNLTKLGAKFLAMKAFPEKTQKNSRPKIVHSETFREGDLVFFRVFFPNPNVDADVDNDPKGFGFVGVNGSGWGLEDHLFSSPSYGRKWLWHPGRLEYPFNHLCDTGPTYESDVKVWIYDNAGRKSPSKEIHLACSARCEVVTPFHPNSESAFTWDDVSSSPGSCRAGIAR